MWKSSRLGVAGHRGGIWTSIDAIIIEYSKAFELFPHDRLLTKLVASGVELRVVVLVRKFLVGCKHKINVRSQQYKKSN